jgi:hypothetical protein
MAQSRLAALMGYPAQLRTAAAEAPDFALVRAMRERARTLEEQQALALEDRRAFAREYVQANPVTGSVAMAVLPPAEQVYKGVNALFGRQVGRSGYFAPLANIGAAYQGALEGLATGRRKGEMP